MINQRPPGGSLLQKWLAAHDLSQAEFGRRVNRTRAAVHNWITGRRRPRVDDLAAIERETDGEITMRHFASAPRPAGEEPAEAVAS